MTQLAGLAGLAALERGQVRGSKVGEENGCHAVLHCECASLRIFLQGLESHAQVKEKN